ncbi:MAG: tRNA/rRNA methyltransferase [Candidatus Neomarinimicrobiota bacterium]
MTTDYLKLTFILVRPARPENIGAAARALKTMGFDSLCLISPADHLSEPARRLAHGAGDLLDSARVFDSLEAAVAGCDLVIGTSAKHKHSHQDYHQPEQVLDLIKSKIGTIATTAIVFGGEESGLSKKDLGLCHLVSSIPLAAAYPSLNLAQAVMIYAYALAPLALKNSPAAAADLPAMEWTTLHCKTANLLAAIDLPPGSQLHGRILERLGLLGTTDIHLLLSIIGRLERKLQTD